MAGRPCIICSNAKKARRCAEMIAAGSSDRAIAAEVGVHRLSVMRHRQKHVVAPARALLDAAVKGQDVRERRSQMLAAAEAGDPTAFIELAAIVADLRKVHERLERTADAAEQDNQRLAVASLSAQALRAVEARAKIGGVGAYAPQRGREGGETPTFSLTINLPGGRTERLDMAPAEVPDDPVGRPVFKLPVLTTAGKSFEVPALEAAAIEQNGELDEEV